MPFGVEDREHAGAVMAVSVQFSTSSQVQKHNCIQVVVCLFAPGWRPHACFTPGESSGLVVEIKVKGPVKRNEEQPISWHERTEENRRVVYPMR